MVCNPPSLLSHDIFAVVTFHIETPLLQVSADGMPAERSVDMRLVVIVHTFTLYVQVYKKKNNMSSVPL